MNPSIASTYPMRAASPYTCARCRRRVRAACPAASFAEGGHLPISTRLSCGAANTTTSRFSPAAPNGAEIGKLFGTCGLASALPPTSARLRHSGVTPTIWNSGVDPQLAMAAPNA